MHRHPRSYCIHLYIIVKTFSISKNFFFKQSFNNRLHLSSVFSTFFYISRLRYYLMLNFTCIIQHYFLFYHILVIDDSIKYKYKNKLYLIKNKLYLQQKQFLFYSLISYLEVVFILSCFCYIIDRQKILSINLISY